jgi:hypothetical protein
MFIQFGFAGMCYICHSGFQSVTGMLMVLSNTQSGAAVFAGACGRATLSRLINLYGRTARASGEVVPSRHDSMTSAVAAAIAE